MVSETRCRGYGCFHPGFKEALEKFPLLSSTQKVRAVAGAIFLGLLTLPFGAIAGTVFFRKYVQKIPVMTDSIHLPLIGDDDPLLQSLQIHVQQPVSIASLMHRYVRFMSDNGFGEIPYSESESIAIFQDYLVQFPVEFDQDGCWGYVEKRDLEPGSQIFVKGDLHGDLRSLVETLRGLCNLGYLDHDYKVKKGLNIVFLGDYVDRGSHGLEVLLLLARLRMENSKSVFLIRGNHEEVGMNRHYLESKTSSDPHLNSFIFDSFQGSSLLRSFYQTLPLSVYLSQAGEDREYVQFTHGAFEFKWNPQKLLDDKSPSGRVAVPMEMNFQPRAGNLTSWREIECRRMLEMAQKQGNKDVVKELKCILAVKRIQYLIESEPPRQYYVNWFQWGDVTGESGETVINGTARPKIAPTDIKSYFRCCNGPYKGNKIKLLYRGHEHLKRYDCAEGDKLICVTMPVAMDIPMFRAAYPHQFDEGQFLAVATKVRLWVKRVLFRDPAQSRGRLTEWLSIMDKRQ